ncbi:MAG: hemolysin family protein [Acidimicrobiales bacterium]|jgi:CBS domain containing-hemolysin-like protein|nr:hemolysin family protein [Acidimicrobiales bacterium]MDG1877671.1 hemolysin family protein [Acidimicrobiales bacterium]
MSAGLLVGVVGTVALIVLAAVVAAAETALTRISRARAGGFDIEENPGAQALIDLLEERETSLAPLLLLRIVSHVAAVAIIITLVADRATGGLPLVGAAVGSAVGLYILPEAIPRIWALQHLDRAALISARGLRILLRMAPVRALTRLLTGIANVLLPGPAGATVISEDELIAMTEAAAAGAAIDEEEKDLIESVFALGDTIVREVMVPRTDMATAASENTVSEVIDLAEAKGFSRVPICGQGIDDIVGVCLVKDLVRLERSGGGERQVISLMRKPRFVPETKHADDLLREMQAGLHHLSIVVDEYGGTAGLVTLEDLVEELVGEIVDETDREEPLYRSLAGGDLLVHGRMPIDQLEGLLKEDFADGDWDTVGGLIFHDLGHVPEMGESVAVNGVRLHVEAMEGRRITRVRVDRAGAGDG